MPLTAETQFDRVSNTLHSQKSANMLDMSTSRERAEAVIDEALPGMLEELVRDFYTPDKFSNSDKIKTVELFMKTKGMLQQNQTQQLMTVDINFIAADTQAKSRTLTIDVHDVVETQPALDLPKEKEEKEPEMEVSDPFANLQSILEGV